MGGHVESLKETSPAFFANYAKKVVSLFKFFAGNRRLARISVSSWQAELTEILTYSASYQPSELRGIAGKRYDGCNIASHIFHPPTPL